MARVSALVQAELGKILDQRVRDPDIPPFVTVHSVRVASDLRVADVNVTFLESDPERVERAMAALNRSSGFIRRELGREVRIKYLPALRFHYTTATQDAMRLDEVLRRARGEEREAQPPEPGDREDVREEEEE